VTWARQSHYFVDFMRDAPEPTGDETEEADMELPKVYEPVNSLDDLQVLFTYRVLHSHCQRSTVMERNWSVSLCFP